MGDRSIVPAELGCFLSVDHVAFWCDTLPFRQFEVLATNAYYLPCGRRDLLETRPLGFVQRVLHA
jgi:hypothetical protein